ncbi:putative Mus7/MMS22 family-domain-containing protein [Seiridium cardinale]|uniref:Mus7/MMS22 family-domain-containing protein n=1 Tax=Seiridium cardinale TaxID=138064 RepID=A0ABR2XY82_9PEZI
MAKWRELGEVPDSDEESLFDSEESQQSRLPPPTSNTPPDEPTTGDTTPQLGSVWDVPLSSSPGISERGGPLVQRRRIEIHIPAKSTQQEEDTASSPLSSPDISDDETIPLVTRNKPQNQVDEQRDAPSQQNSYLETSTEHIPEVSLVEDDEIVARHESARLGRSLRPRKPIQEHPYLLENAQYSTLFKTHGIRPVRLPTVEERQRAQEEDSQEQDYEDDSQVTLGIGQNNVTEESRELLRRASFDDDLDELALSSPTRLSSSPHRATVSQDVPNSSQNDEDLPSLGDLFTKTKHGRPRTYAKRKYSPKQSSKRKAPRLQHPVGMEEPTSPLTRSWDLFDIPPSPPQTSPAFSATTQTANFPKARTTISSLTPRPSSANVSRDPTPARANLRAAIDLTNIPDLDSEEDAAAMTDDSEQHNLDRTASNSPAPEMAFQRRIKGVLPASWIRLDHQVPRGRVQKPLRRSPERSPERVNRKGVAQRRQVSPKPSNDLPFFFDDDSEDDTNLRNDDSPGILETTEFPIFEDDAASVIEEDHIDHMLPGRKRLSADQNGQSRPAVKKMKTQKTFKGQPGLLKRQQRITGMLNRSKSGTQIGKPRPTASTTGSRSQRQRPRLRQVTPPRLSILDVVERDPPLFIKIAARAASKRPDKGKSSPSGKHISLGSRQDNIDAIGVLRNWKTGKIRSRLPSAAPVQRTTNPRPLHPISNNHLSRAKSQQSPANTRSVPVGRFSRSRKLVNGVFKIADSRPAAPTTDSRSLPDESELPAPAPIRRLLGRSKTQGAPLRPAQLETIGDEQISRRAFHARKKVLDALYRRSRKTQPSGPESQLEQVFQGQIPKPGLPPPTDHVPITSVSDRAAQNKPRARPRKLVRPRHIDTTAPQYAHANDPLPEEQVPPAETVHTFGNLDNKLLGLGPYGTHYTQHFEVFPLDGGVFFHESTLIGQGKITKAFDDKSLDSINQPRGQCTLTLGDQPLRWGEWNAQTSSEFGVLFDWIADQMQITTLPVEIDTAPVLTVVQAANFSVDYVQETIYLPDVDSGRLFVHRIQEVISGFLARLDLMTIGEVSNRPQIINVLTRCLLVVLQALRICGKLALTEALQVEALLAKTAKQTAQVLLQTGPVEMTGLLNELRAPSVRARGIKNEHFSVISWVALIRVLQESRIPRSGFWDVVCSAMLEPGVSSDVDAQRFEQLWHTFFSILPLGEFDNAGVVVPGSRQSLPLEGWTLPQKLLGRVFELYRTNQRQSPSFNDYCRALVGRCHFLVEQWGWRKCSSVIGTVFDFFASQNLSHLRNEEAYKSPQFLEELAGSPSLAVQPEDRCFHIFLKLLALSIQRLRRYGLIKDVKNLIARVLPNHDRQYLKESDVHENELASLRNHHDLLCTLFWCSPQALRPSVQMLEKLVTPGNSHKEACLINLRAWNQLARFVVSTGEDMAVYKSFASWQNNVFKQVLDQYLSVESDIQQQFLGMSKDASSGVSPELMKRVINMNKQAATDVLHFSLKANLDAMHHARSLAAASIVLNTYQLHEVFTPVCSTTSAFDWSTQGVAVDILDHYVGRIEGFVEDHGTSESADSWHGEDAILALERHVAVPFFSMAQKMIANSADDQPIMNDGKLISTERTVTVASRLAVLFLRHTVASLSCFFSTGKYRLFQGLPVKLPLHSRRYLCLFIAILVEKQVTDFKGINATSIELFLCAIAKPHPALAYEYRLAEALKRQNDCCLKDVIVPKHGPDYGANRDLIDRTLFLMRRAVRFAAINQRQQLKEDFSKALKSVMEQMKADLKSLANEASAHVPYMQFVQMIIPLIKKYDFCPVDEFFYQISSEYSPPSQDPRLKTAQILYYGLKLEEGDTQSPARLFYFLYSNFKVAMINGKIEQERAILGEGIENQHVFSFMLSRMLPAIVKTSVKVPEAWLLLDTYVRSVEDLLDGVTGPGGHSRPCIPQEVGPESMGHLLVLFKHVSAAISHVSNLSVATMGAEYVHVLTQLIRLSNLFGPSLVAYLCLPENSSSSIGLALQREIKTFTDFTRAAEEHLYEDLCLAVPSQHPFQVKLLPLLEELQFYFLDTTLDKNEQINAFSKEMEDDVQKTWYSTGSTISAKGPPKPLGTSTQSGQGTAVPIWDMRKTAQELYEQLKEWNYAFDRSADTAWKRRRVVPIEDQPF